MENKPNNQINKGRRKSVTYISNLSLNATVQNQKIGSPSPKRKKRQSVINVKDSPNLVNSGKNNKSKKIIINTDNLNVEKIKGKTTFQNQKRRGSYSDLFKLKQSYVSNDINLTQKQQGKYSELYKNGIRVFDDLEKEEKKNSNNNSLRSSFALSITKSRNALKDTKIGGRRASLQPSIFRNKNFNLLEGLGIKIEKNGTEEYVRTLSNNKINKDKNNNSESNSDSDSDSSDSSSSSSSSSNSQNNSVSSSKGNKNNLSNNSSEQKIKKKNSLKKSFQSNNSSNKSQKSSKKKISDEEKAKYLKGNGVVIEMENKAEENTIKEVEEEDEEGRFSNNKLNRGLRKSNFKKDYKNKKIEQSIDKINNLDEDIKKQVLRRNKSFDKNESKISEEFKLDKKDIEKFIIRSRSLGNLLIKIKKYNMKNVNRILEDNKILNSGCFTAKDIFKAQLNKKINNLDEDIKRQVLRRNKSFDKNESKISEEFKLDKKDIEKFIIKSRSLGNLLIKIKKYNMKNVNRILEDNKILNSGCFTAKDIFKAQLNDKLLKKLNNLDEDIKKQVLKRNKSFDKNKSKVNEEFKLSEKDIEKFIIKSRSLGNLLIKIKKYNMKNINRILEDNKLINSGCFTAKDIFKAQLNDKINNLDEIKLII